MSEAIVLPSLSQWTKNHLTAIIQANSASALNASLDAFLFKDAVIIVNGRHINRAEFTTLLRTKKVEEATASISFAGAVEVPTNRESQSELAGSVGVFFTATIAQAIIIQGVPVESLLTASINVVIEQDESLPPPPHGLKGFADRRRVKVLNEVVLEGPVLKSV